MGRSLALLLIIPLTLSLGGKAEPPRIAHAAALVGRTGAQFVGLDGNSLGFVLWGYVATT